MGARTLLVGLVIGVAIVVALVAVTRCLPEPGNGVEWVQRTDSIIVQMKVNGFHLVESSGIDPYVIVPEFTLYGDGTLIASKTGGKCPCQLIKAKLSDNQVQDLLHYIDGTGFFNFTYIEPGGPDSAPTTYIYAATKKTQNISGRHFELATCIGDCTPPSHYRTLGQIEGRLEQVIEAAVSSGTAAGYWADSIVLSAKITNVTIRSTPPEWPLPQVDLAAIANGSDFGSRRMEGDLAKKVQEVLTDYQGETDYLVNGQWYAVGYTPVLPYEENFPEFEPPSGAPTP